MDKEKAIKTAAKWWADKVCGNAPDTGFVKDHMDANAVPVLNLLFGNNNGVDSVSRTIFQDVLEQEIGRTMDADGYANLWVDYRPCTILAKAAEEADIDEFRLPFKTELRIKPAEPNGYKVEAGPFCGTLEAVPPCED